MGDLIQAPHRSDILKLQDAIAAMPQVEQPVAHYFAPGLYARECTLLKDSLVVGKIHKHAHINTISKGRVLVSTEFGTDELCAPCTFVSIPGTKRAVLALEETIWTTYHPTEETDLEKIEEHVIAKSYDEYDALPCAKKTEKLEDKTQ